MKKKDSFIEIFFHQVLCKFPESRGLEESGGVWLGPQGSSGVHQVPHIEIFFFTKISVDVKLGGKRLLYWNLFSPSFMKISRYPGSSGFPLGLAESGVIRWGLATSSRVFYGLLGSARG